MIRIHLACISSVLLFSCSPRTSGSPEPEQFSVAGKWKIAVQQTVMTQADQGGKTYTTTVNENEWQQDANRSIPVVTYTPEGNYHTVYFDYEIHDSVHMVGTYTFSGDTLVAKDAQGVMEPLVSRITFAGKDQFEMEARIDTDGDGKKDDAIIATLKRVQ